MRKQVRTKILIERIEAAIAKNQNRIKRISEENFELRKSLEGLQALPTDKSLTKAELDERDKKNKVGKYYDAAYHEQQRLDAKKAAEAVLEEVKKIEAAQAEAIKDSADQEIGMSAPSEDQ